jgi:small subunit ribosomal protein S2
MSIIQQNSIEIFKKKFPFYNIDFYYNNKFHIGQLLYRYNIYMRYYILYKNKNFYLFNMLKTLINLKHSIFFIMNLMYNRGKLVIIDSNKEYKYIFHLYQKITKQIFFNFKWIGGLMTNFKEFFYIQKKSKKKIIKSFQEERKETSSSDFLYYRKRGFFTKLTRLPDIVLFFNSYINKIALKEIQILGIPNIAIVNSDVNPCNINFVLANKDSNFIVCFFFISIYIESILLGFLYERFLYFKIIKHFYYFKFLYNIKKN